LYHPAGNVFEGILRILDHHRPSLAVFENVQGLLSNKYGHTFASVLKALTDRGYAVDWLLINAAWFGVPQERKRLIIIASTRMVEFTTQSKLFDDGSLPIIHPCSFLLSTLCHNVGVSLAHPKGGQIKDIELARRPRVGLRKPDSITPFLQAGVASGDLFVTWDTMEPQTSPESDLGDIVAPRYCQRQRFRSARYWAHSGTTRIYVKDDPVSHCIGTSIGAAPLFAMPAAEISCADESEALEFSNWHVRQQDLFVLRLVPDRALLLFGSDLLPLSPRFKEFPLAETKKYRLLGNLVCPRVAEAVGRALSPSTRDVTAFPANGR
jgi:hypothetical protein